MSKRVLLLVEGQTEERFVKDILEPAYLSKNIYFYPTLLVTKRAKNGPNFKGGVTNFAKFHNDVQRLLNSAGDALVSTMLDYYALPNDFPGMKPRTGHSPLEKVEHIEDAIADHFGRPRNFIPFLALHEFEAWLFSSPEELPSVMTAKSKQQAFSDICAEFSTPEDINEHPESAPSKRIVSLFPAYRKTLHGPTVAKRIGLEKIRLQCPHFSLWLKKLEETVAQ
jgi:hypothetical protein